MADRRIQDEMRYCARCGISFLWSIEEQRSSAGQTGDSGLQPPISGGKVAPPACCSGCRLIMSAPGRERGLVKWYSMRKRYGFIVRRDEPEIFVPAASLDGVRVLQTGDLVEFRVGFNNQGPVAEAVTLVMAATAAELVQSADPAQGEGHQPLKQSPAARRSRF